MKTFRIILLILFLQPIIVCAQTDSTGTNNGEQNYGRDCRRIKRLKEQKRIIDSIWTDSIQRIEKTHNTTVQVLNDSINRLNKVLNGYITKIQSFEQQIKDSSDCISKLSYLLTHQSTIRNKDYFFCRAILESPLYTPYNADNVEFCKEMVSWMGYDKSKDKTEKYIYNTFYPLVEHYKEFTDQIVEYLNYTISEFDYSPNRLSEQKKFKERLERSKYYEYRCKNGNSYMKIYFLEYIIKETLVGFEKNETFKKKYYVDIRDYILGKN